MLKHVGLLLRAHIAAFGLAVLSGWTNKRQLRTACAFLASFFWFRPFSQWRASTAQRKQPLFREMARKHRSYQGSVKLVAAGPRSWHGCCPSFVW